MRRRSLSTWAAVTTLVLGVTGCEGPRGPRGDPGEPGAEGPAGDAGVRGADGARGDAGERGPAGDSGQAPPADVLAREPDGVVGIVRDPGGALVAGGDVYFVPAEDVAELAQTPIDLSLSPAEVAALATDEPLEDLLDLHAEEYQRATVGEDGRYALSELADGHYFVVFRPAASDAFHLPGGSGCRSAVDQASLAGTQLDLRVSGRAGEDATYVGSSGCFGCHGRHRSMRTSHRVGLQVPGVRGPFQDTSRWPAFDAGLRAFEDAATLYYYDCDPSGGGEAHCSVSPTDPTLAVPSAVVSFEIELARNSLVRREEVGAYTLTIVNRQGAGTASYDVALTYGGAISKQHYLTRWSNPDGTLGYYVLPLQFNIAGDDGYPSASDWVFRDYGSPQWYDFAGSTLRQPESADAFDNRCAGCHLTGMTLSGDESSGFGARAVADANGDFDYDGDGRSEEINVGCEGCHGPASEHLERRGARIVSPSLLTPERELMVCGRCHSRPLGAAGAASEAPLSPDGAMPRAGLRRSEYAAGFTTRVDGAESDLHPSGDARSHHAQYSDFIRSGMHRNGSVLMTCTSCHDAHGSDDHEHELLLAADDNASCTGCHSAAPYVSPRGHVETATGFVHDASADSEFVCTACHMVRTVASGARHPELLDNIPSTPTVQYFHGDIASHRFAVTAREHYTEQPVAATLRCGFCHGTDFANP